LRNTVGVPFGREEHTPRANGVSVYYPFVLVELLGYTQVDDSEEDELLLSFADEDGCRVTVKVRRAVIAALIARLSAPPDPSSDAS
jgi:hypothetical protein